jgi:ABC-2 type transport system ATP-binding protein
MYRGRLIQCDAPETVRHQMAEHCYQVEAPDPRAAREYLRRAEGVLSVEPCGATLHLFLVPARTSPEALRMNLDQSGLGPAAFRRIVPSLEDVFIALVRRAELQ